MNLNEHQAKNILRESGIAVPSGIVCTSADMAQIKGPELSAGPWVIKAQIPAGGRANGHFKGDPQARGGIRFAENPAQIESHSKQMLGSVLVTAQTGNAGARVDSIYIEEFCTVKHEYYLSLTIDSETGQLIFVAAQQGGASIEQLAIESPKSILQLPVPLEGTLNEKAKLAEHLGIAENIQEYFFGVVETMRNIFVERDMLLLEINPLAVTTNDQLIALDATIVFDDNAMFRQGHEELMNAYDNLQEQEYAAANFGLNYVKLDGNIATLSAGAGLAMATMDAIVECGGAPANFLDVPPSISADTFKNAVNLLSSDPGVRCLLINVFGGGIMRCDAVADAILLSNRDNPFTVPVVVRFAGTNAKLAVARLSSSLPSVVIAADLADAAKKSTELAGKQGVSAETGSNPDSWWGKVRKLLPETTN